MIPNEDILVYRKPVKNVFVAFSPKSTDFTYTPVSIEQLIANDHSKSLVGGLGPEPGGHAGVDDDADVALVADIQAEQLLHVRVRPAVGLLAPDRGVEDDLDALVHHGGLLHGVAAAGVELVQEVSLGLNTLVVHPGAFLLVPGATVDGHTVDQSVRTILTDKLECFRILRIIQ